MSLKCINNNLNTHTQCLVFSLFVGLSFAFYLRFIVSVYVMSVHIGELTTARMWQFRTTLWCQFSPSTIRVPGFELRSLPLPWPARLPTDSSHKFKVLLFLMYANAFLLSSSFFYIIQCKTLFNFVFYNQKRKEKI